MGGKNASRRKRYRAGDDETITRASGARVREKKKGKSSIHRNEEKKVAEKMQFPVLAIFRSVSAVKQSENNIRDRGHPAPFTSKRTSG